MSTTTIPTKLAHDIAARLCQEADTAARELRTRLIDCMQDATSPGLTLVHPLVPERPDRMMICASGCGLQFHRWRPAPEAGPHWRCSVCGEETDPEPLPSLGEPPVSGRAVFGRARGDSFEPIEPAEQDEFKPVAGPLGLAIFVSGDYVDARDAHAVPRKGEVLTVNGKRCMVSLVEWTGPAAANVHTQPLLRLPSVDGGPF